MDRFLSVCLLAMLLLTPARGTMKENAQPVFFSLLFPQLIAGEWIRDNPGEAVVL